MPHAHQLGGAAHAHAHGLGHPHSHVHNDKSSSGGHNAWPTAGGGREGTTAAASQRRRLQRSYGRRFTPADLPQEAFAGLPGNQAAAASEAVGAAQHGGGADWRQQLARMQPRPEQASGVAVVPWGGRRCTLDQSVGRACEWALHGCSPSPAGRRVRRRASSRRTRPGEPRCPSMLAGRQLRHACMCGCAGSRLRLHACVCACVCVGGCAQAVRCAPYDLDRSLSW